MVLRPCSACRTRGHVMLRPQALCMHARISHLNPREGSKSSTSNTPWKHVPPHKDSPTVPWSLLTTSRQSHRLSGTQRIPDAGRSFKAAPIYAELTSPTGMLAQVCPAMHALL
eukprot:355982-Chlamydomonas_euryale.AAC.4